MSNNPYFLEILERSKEIHLKKSQDYTTNTETNPHENFERAALIASWFPQRYSAFAVLIGTKVARLASLLTKEEQSSYTPNNESTDDSFLDCLTYVGLFYSYWKTLRTRLLRQQVLSESYKIPLDSGNDDIPL